jgi:hypothetical protein
MGIKRITQTKTSPSGEVSPGRLLQLSYEFGTLVVSDVAENAGVETITPALIQPWKCNEDGSRSAFESEEDAFAWFESMQNLL